MLDVAGFLALLFPDLRPGEYIESRPLDAAGNVLRRYRAWSPSAGEAARHVAGLPACNAYFGVCPRRYGGGKKEHVTRVLAPWADVDFKHFRDGEAGARAALAAFPLAPSLVVHSGGGLQAYWLLTLPLVIAGPADIARVEGLLRRLYARLGGLDGVQDLSRIMRVPGTLNHKYDPPRPVTALEYAPARRYALEDFEALLPPSESPRRIVLPPVGGHSLGRATGGRRAGPPAIEELREMLRFIDPLLPYEEWVRVAMAVHDAYPGRDGWALVDEWSTAARERHGCNGTLRKQPEKWGQFRQPGRAGNVGIGTLVYLAQLHGWRPAVRPRADVELSEVLYA
jgi:hypothetical protein